MRGTIHFATALLLLGGCANTQYFPDGGTPGEAGCTAGQTQCTANVWETCTGGTWSKQDCGSKLCVKGLGCRLCEPNSDFCDGMDVYTCSGDGNSRTKVKTCIDGQQCAAGMCLDLCDLPQKDRSNVGCEFWAVDLPNEYYCTSIDGGATCMMYGCAACQQYAVVVANINSFPVQITVDINEAKPGEAAQVKTTAQKSVAPYSLEVFNLPMREVDCSEWKEDAQKRLRRVGDSQTCLSSRAYRVKSSSPVVAYQFNPIINDFSNGASLLIPTNGLDLKYYVMGWSTANPISLPMPGQEGIPDYMSLTVIGVKDGTEVEVTLAHPTQASKDGKIPAAKKGDTVKVVLGPFDVLNINTIQDFAFPTGDLTGSLVKASKPVVVFSSGQRVVVPGGFKYNPEPPKPSDPNQSLCCTEHIEQQMFPISSLGTTFAITRTPIRSTGIVEPDFYRVLATKDNVTTNITTNLAEFPKFTLQTGQWADFWATKDFVLESDKPVMVAQYAVSQGYLDNWSPPGGDPEFVIFAPVEQHRKDYIFLTPTTFDKDYVIIASPQSSVVKLDGQEVSSEFQSLCPKFELGTIKGEKYKAIRCDLKDGVHRVEATKPVGIMVYGYYNVGSYGYPGGADIKQINID
jgi:hypothetical protein